MQVAANVNKLAEAEGWGIDPDRAEPYLRFLKRCKQSRPPYRGVPISLLDWQRNDFIYPLFCCGKLNEQGEWVRRFNRAGVWVPKKQGKSTLSSTVGLFWMLESKASECFCIASDINQAKIVFNEAAHMASTDPLLSKRLWIRHNINTIVDRLHGSSFKVLSATREGKAGINANLLIYDELAEWPQSVARDIWDQLKYASAARQNSLHLVISTAQYDRESLGFEQYEYAKRVTTGENEDTRFLPVIYEVPAGEDWRNEDLWWRANPSVGVTVPHDDWRLAYKETLNNARLEAAFRTLRLNQWIGHAEQWLSSDTVDRCTTPESEWPQEVFATKPVIGVDYALHGDLAAIVTMWRHEGHYYIRAKAYLPQDTIADHIKSDGVPYWRWLDQSEVGFRESPGETMDADFFNQEVVGEYKATGASCIVYDPHMFHTNRQQIELQHGLPMSEVGSQWNIIGPPTVEFERLARAQKIHFPDSPMWKWMIGNCVTRPSPQKDLIRIDKRRVTARIDCIDAAIAALAKFMADEETCIYNTHRLIVV